MRCPVDGTTLMLAERAGVEVDYCPQCRGVWLDRGELDRVIERSTGYDRERHREEQHDRDRHDDEDDEYRGARYERPRRRRGGAFTALTDLLGGGGD